MRIDCGSFRMLLGLMLIIGVHKKRSMARSVASTCMASTVFLVVLL